MSKKIRNKLLKNKIKDKTKHNGIGISSEDELDQIIFMDKKVLINKNDIGFIGNIPISKPYGTYKSYNWYHELDIARKISIFEERSFEKNWKEEGINDYFFYKDVNNYKKNKKLSAQSERESDSKYELMIFDIMDFVEEY